MGCDRCYEAFAARSRSAPCGRYTVRIRAHRQSLGAIRAEAAENGAGASRLGSRRLAGTPDVVLSTRARLARNLAGVPFPGHASEASELAGPLRQAGVFRLPGIATRVSRPCARSRSWQVWATPTKRPLVDSHLISVAARGGRARTAGRLVDDKHTVSVMVNEEDHLRLQAILPGFAVGGRMAKSQTDWTILFARAPGVMPKHAQYGFLTASLSNCGTGLRLSVMTHLPGAGAVGQTGRRSDGGALAWGCRARPLRGRLAGRSGDVYQISNAVSIGQVGAANLSARYLNAVVTTYPDPPTNRPRGNCSGSGRAFHD